MRQFHDDSARDARRLESIDLRDIRMIQRRQDLRFPLKAAKSLRVVFETAGQELDRNGAKQLRVARARKTTPIPPSPSGAVISYGPMRSPGLGDIARNYIWTFV